MAGTSETLEIKHLIYILVAAQPAPLSWEKSTDNTFRFGLRDASDPLTAISFQCGHIYLIQWCYFSLNWSHLPAHLQLVCVAATLNIKRD